MLKENTKKKKESLSTLLLYDKYPRNPTRIELLFLVQWIIVTHRFKPHDGVDQIPSPLK